MSKDNKKRRKRRYNPNKRYINQKLIHINKKISHHMGEYFSIDTKYTNEAMRNLTGSAFKLYIFLCEIKDGNTYLISEKKFKKSTGLSQPAYQYTRKELIEKHYLIEREDGDYDFYNYPFIVLTGKDAIVNDIVEKIKSENSVTGL